MPGSPSMANKKSPPTQFHDKIEYFNHVANNNNTSPAALVPGGVVTTQNISTVIRPKGNENSLQFVKIQTPELSKKAVEQIRLAEDSKISKNKIKEVEEEWQNNLLSWKSKRRQQFPQANDNEQINGSFESNDGSSGRRYKTFAEMIEQRAKSGNRLSFHLQRYVGDDDYEAGAEEGRAGTVEEQDAPAAEVEAPIEEDIRNDSSPEHQSPPRSPPQSDSPLIETPKTSPSQQRHLRDDISAETDEEEKVETATIDQDNNNSNKELNQDFANDETDHTSVSDTPDLVPEEADDSVSGVPYFQDSQRRHMQDDDRAETKQERCAEAAIDKDVIVESDESILSEQSASPEKSPPRITQEPVVRNNSISERQSPPKPPPQFNHPLLETPKTTPSQRRHIRDDNEKPYLSVSGKKRCSSCREELGRGAAAFVVESLSLVYHTNCFRCSVCHANLANGFKGVNVRVHAGALHCHNCYSKDGLNYSRV